MSNSSRTEVKVAAIGCMSAVLVALITVSAPLIQDWIRQSTSTPVPPAPTSIVETNPASQATTAPLSTTTATSLPPPPTDIAIVLPTPFSPPPLLTPVQTDPNQPLPVTDEQHQRIWAFINSAFQAEISAYYYGNSTYLDTIIAGDALNTMQTEISDLNNQGLVRVFTFDPTQSYIYNARNDSVSKVTVEICSMWSSTTAQRATGVQIAQSPPTLYPQTLVLEQIATGWFITSMTVHTAPAFCS